MSASPSLTLNLSELWHKFSSLYGRAFTKSQGTEVDPSGVWALALSFLKEGDIEYGFKKVVLMDEYNTFPPNAMQFRDICLSRRVDKGLPSLNEAYVSSKNYFNRGVSITSHKAVMYCALKIGELAFLEWDERRLFSAFKSLYERVSLASMQGLSLPKLNNPIQKKSVNKDVAKKYLSQIKSKLL